MKIRLFGRQQQQLPRGFRRTNMFVASSSGAPAQTPAQAQAQAEVEAEVEARAEAQAEAQAQAHTIKFPVGWRWCITFCNEQLRDKRAMWPEVPESRNGNGSC